MTVATLLANWQHTLSQMFPDNCCEGWFTTEDGFVGQCLVDRGAGLSRIVELRSHEGLIQIATLAKLQRLPDGSLITVQKVFPCEEPPKPENSSRSPVALGEPEVGDMVTWNNAPYWWNPSGERLSEISGGFGFIDFWRNPVPYEQLRVVIKSLSLQVDEVAA